MFNERNFIVMYEYSIRKEIAIFFYIATIFSVYNVVCMLVYILIAV